MVKKNPELGESTSSVPAQADEQGSRINFLISENIRAFSDYGKSLNVNNPDGPRYIAVSRALQLADSMLSGMNDVYCPIELQKALLVYKDLRNLNIKVHGLKEKITNLEQQLKNNLKSEKVLLKKEVEAEKF